MNQQDKDMLRQMNELARLLRERDPAKRRNA